MLGAARRALMLDAALIGTLALMGAASVPHCALMCGAPCAAAVGGGQAPAMAGFQIGRLLGYAALGAVAAAAVGLLREAAAANAVLRPLWTGVQAALFALGLYLLLSGRWPAWLGQLGHKPSGTVRWQRATGAGLLWFAWPCGVLQGALLVAALANTPLGAASAMAAFALASSPGLLAAPLLMRKLLARPQVQTWVPRLAGAMLMLASGWALLHGLWLRIVELCT